MEKNKCATKLIFRIFLAILLCVVSAFSFVGCLGGSGSYTGGGVGSGSGGGSGSGSSSGSGGGGSSSGGSGTGGSGSIYPEIPSFSDNFFGAIAVYETNTSDKVFYDTFIPNKAISFSDLVNRQFNTLSNTIFNVLNRIYGDFAIDEIPTSPTGIVGYTSDSLLSYKFTEIMSDNWQGCLAKINNNVITNSEYLNYRNAINGGYVIGDDGAYTSEISSSNAWLKAADFNENFLKKCLMIIYHNTQEVDVSDFNYNLTSDSGLKNYYNSFFDLYSSEDIESFSASEITRIGLTPQYMWNVLYFLGYSVIGESNLNNSIDTNNASDNYSKIFSGTGDNKRIQVFDIAYKLAYQNYKGYDEVLYSIVTNLPNMAMGNDLSIKFDKTYFIETDDSYDLNSSISTLYPTLACEQLIFYPDVEDLAESVDNATGSDFIGGTLRKFKRLILLPKSTTNINGLLLCIESNTGIYQLEVLWRAWYNDAADFVDGSSSFVLDGTEYSKLTFDNTSTSDDAVDIELDVDKSKVLGVAELFDGTKITDEMIGKWFDVDLVDITYEDGKTGVKTMGYLKSYNKIYKLGAVLNFGRNTFMYNFEYYDEVGAPVDDIPFTLIHYFYPYN